MVWGGWLVINGLWPVIGSIQHSCKQKGFKRALLSFLARMKQNPKAASDEQARSGWDVIFLKFRASKWKCWHSWTDGVVPWTCEICVWWGWLGRREAKLPGSVWPLVRNRTRERGSARDGLAVVHWRHRPLSWGECGGCAPAFEALPPTNSGLPISTHCVDTPHPPSPPSPSFCFPYKARLGHFLSRVVRVFGHCAWWLNSGKTITSLWINLRSNNVQCHHTRSFQFHPHHRCWEHLQIACCLVKLLISGLCMFLWQLRNQRISSSVRNVTVESGGPIHWNMCRQCAWPH